MKQFWIMMFLMVSPLLHSQERPPEVLSFQEYLAYVKKFHPVTRQANLLLDVGEAELLQARGGFDPKIEVDYDRKEFKGTEYYDLLNSTFKIPTWYGVELKANFEQNSGVYLNPQNTVPPDGLFSAGVSVDVGRGMFINERMAAIRNARIFQDQSLAERDLMVNDILFEAALAYFDWLRVYNEMSIFEGFLINARERYQGVRQNALLGEIAAIDTVEAKIAVQNRMLELEQARVNLIKERLNVSNFLWLENNIPVELQPQMVPDRQLPAKIDEILDIPLELPMETVLENHPKLRSLEFKLRALELERRLKRNNLLPQVNLEYNFLTPEVETIESFNRSDYKAGVSVRFPLFLRKERGALRLANFKIQDTEFDIDVNERQIENKILGVYQELESYRVQNALAEDMVANYRMMLDAEERMMTFGESSLFLINTREIKLIEAQLKQNDLLTKFLYAKARLFQNLGIIPSMD